MPRFFVQAVEPSKKDRRDNDLWLGSSHTDWMKILPLIVAKLEELEAQQ